MTEPKIPGWRKPIDSFAGSSVGSAILRRMAPLLDRPLMKLTGGRFAMTFGLPTLLLTTTGRKSGEPRPTPLLYLTHGAGLVVIGTRFGSPSHPAWVLNLRENPTARVLLNGEEFGVTAREASADERIVIWEQAKKLYGGYDKYQARAGEREIPVLLLSRS